MFGPYVSFVVLPLFALANAGVRLDARHVAAALRSPLTWGIIARPCGRQVHRHHRRDGLVQRTGMGQLAPGLTLRRVSGGAALSGIGFTISLFIVDLAIHEPARQDEARVGVLLASVLAFSSAGRSSGSPTGSARRNRSGSKLIRPVDPDRDHIRGNPDAPLTLVEYGDFECPFCSRATGSIDEVRAHFGDELRYVWRHLPLERVHPRAFDAARASEAAALAGQVLRDGARDVRTSRTIWSGRTSTATPTPSGCDIEQFDQDVRFIRRRCCTGCRTTRRTPS